MITCDYYKEIERGLKKVGICIRPEFEYEGKECPYAENDEQDKCAGSD